MSGYECFERPNQGHSCKFERTTQLITLGIVLVVVGLLVKSLSVLVTIGVILLVIGAVLWVLGSMGRAVGGRKHYY